MNGQIYCARCHAPIHIGDPDEVECDRCGLAITDDSDWLTEETEMELRRAAHAEWQAAVRDGLIKPTEARS